MNILKIFLESLKEDVLDYSKDPQVQDWDPRDLAIEYGTSRLADVIDGMEVRRYVEDPKESHSFVNLGVFKDKQIITGIAYYYVLDVEKFKINRKVPLIEKMVVSKEYRGKGLSKELYKVLLNKEGIVFSDLTLFTPTKHLWETFIPSLPNVEMFNFNDREGTYSPYSMEEFTKSMDIRVVAVSSNKLKEVIKNDILN